MVVKVAVRAVCSHKLKHKPNLCRARVPVAVRVSRNSINISINTKDRNRKAKAAKKARVAVKVVDFSIRKSYRDTKHSSVGTVHNQAVEIDFGEGVEHIFKLFWVHGIDLAFDHRFEIDGADKTVCVFQ